MLSDQQKKDRAEYNKKYRPIYNKEKAKKISEYNQKFYLENKEDILKGGEEYHQKNIDNIHKGHEVYYQNHRNGILEKRREYYKNNKDKIKKYIDENRDSVRAQLKNYKGEHKNEIKKWSKEYSQKPEVIFKVYQRSAKLRNFTFKLTYEQFLSFWQKPCYYCGCLIDTIGLDRINNNKGYTVDNIVACCKICNKMKMDLSVKDFITKIQTIISKHSS